MEWTGARYADTPTVEVDIQVDAPPELVWEIVSDIGLMPSMSSELQSAVWLEGVDGPACGHTFVGHNHHETIGDWSTVSYVVECEAPRVFAWAVGDPDVPAARWRFRLEPCDGGTRLSQGAQLGPGRSGLSLAIDRMPDKEQKIVFSRLREFEAAMKQTVIAVKERAEAAMADGA